MIEKTYNSFVFLITSTPRSVKLNTGFLTAILPLSGRLAPTLKCSMLRKSTPKYWFQVLHSLSLWMKNIPGVRRFRIPFLCHCHVFRELPQLYTSFVSNMSVETTPPNGKSILYIIMTNGLPLCQRVPLPVASNSLLIAKGRVSLIELTERLHWARKRRVWVIQLYHT